MKTTLKVNLKPFSVPNYVIIKDLCDGEREPASIALQQLESDVLAKMCEEFTDEVFKRAGKRRPPIERG